MDALNELRAIVARHAKRETLPATLPRLQCALYTRPSPPVTVVAKASLALMVQGAKRTVLGSRTFELGAGHFIVTSVNAPITSEITRASAREPFLGIGLTLRPALLASLLVETAAERPRETPLAIATNKASEELLDAFRRYARLLDAPGDIPILAEAIEREIMWRVMQSAQGAALRDIGLASSNLTHISRAIDLLQKRFTEPLLVADLARAAHMSPATFNRHFRKVTAMSPLQFQKRLRLQEARARLLARPGDVAAVSFAVGYQSASQFSREYRREFGLPPSASGQVLGEKRP